MNPNWEPYDKRPSTAARVAVVLASVVIGLVLLAVAFGIGRATASGGGSKPEPVPPPASSWPGPSRQVDGVPMGYAHTQEAAVKAAASYEMTYQGQLSVDPAMQDKAIRTMAASRAVDALLKGAALVRTHHQRSFGAETAHSQGRQILISTTILAYHVDDYNPDQAKVSLWVSEVIGVEGGRPLLVVYALFPVTLTWEGGDWRLAEVGEPGALQPVPVLTQTSTNQGLPDQLKGFTAYAG